MFSIKFVLCRILRHEKVRGIYVLLCVRGEVTAGGSAPHVREDGGGSIIDFMVKVAGGPGERMILWFYAAIDFRS